MKARSEAGGGLVGAREPAGRACGTPGRPKAAQIAETLTGDLGTEVLYAIGDEKEADSFAHLKLNVEPLIRH